MEYDSDRAGGFEPLRLVPKDKIVVFGLVSTKNSDMETVDDLKRRIDQASKFLPLDQLALSPQCGFGGIDSKVLSEGDVEEVGYDREHGATSLELARAGPDDSEKFEVIQV